MGIDKKTFPITVALIDDHTPLLNAVRKFLESFSIRVLFQAGNGQEALQKLSESDVLPDICILDLNMPVMNGFETATALSNKYPDIKVLAFSVNDDEANVVAMLQSGAKGYILKGADPDEIKKAIEVVYNNRKYFSVGISNIAEEYFRKEAH